MADTSSEVSGLAVVTTDSPLTVTVDGATVACPATTLDGASYAVGDRVRVTIRNPIMPLVEGVVEDESA